MDPKSDGLELVLEKQECGDHLHLTPEQIQAIKFGYCDVTTGGKDPCIELVNLEGQICLRLFYYSYLSSELKLKWEQFREQHPLYQDLLTGQW
jgi:hypothetical protein